MYTSNAAFTSNHYFSIAIISMYALMSEPSYTGSATTPNAVVSTEEGLPASEAQFRHIPRGILIPSMNPVDMNPVDMNPVDMQPLYPIGLVPIESLDPCHAVRWCTRVSSCLCVAGAMVCMCLMIWRSIWL